MRKLRVGMLLLAAASVCWAASGPGTASNWLQQGADSMRDAWQHNETILNKNNVKNLTLLWKIKLNSTPREMHNIFSPVVATVTTASGTRQIAVVAGISDDMFGIDAATGTLLWHRHFTSTYKPAAGGRGPNTLCPGGQTAAPAIGPGAVPGQYVAYAVSWDGRLHQLNVADGRDVAAPLKFMPANGKPYSLNLANGVIYTSTAQGCGQVQNAFFTYDLATHISSAFLPAGGGMWGRNGVAVGPRGTAYMGTGDGGFYPERKELGNAIVAAKLDKATSAMQLAGYFGPPNAIWLWHRDQDINVSPVLFDYQNRHFLAESNKTCAVWLLDRDHFGGTDHRTALYTTPQICNSQVTFDGKGVWGALAAWRDAQGQQWVAVPFWGPVSSSFHAPQENGRPSQGGVATFKVVEQNGKWKLTPAWLSQNMDMGEEAIYANGVVYAYGSGEDTHQQLPDRAWTGKAPSPTAIPTASMGSVVRIDGSSHATLFALDAATGKTLWSSGDQIASWSHFSGISEAGGRVYIPTYDGTLYCFGLPQH